MGWIETKFISLISHRLERFKKSSKKVWTFRCPYCGDSAKNDFKTRGYFYEDEDTVFYKCHNCGTSRNFRSFLKEIFPDQYRDFLFDIFQEKRADEPVKPAAEPEKVNEKFLTPNTSLRFKKKNAFLSNFKSLAVLPDDNPGRAYILGRKIPERFLNSLYYAEDANDVFQRLDLYKEKKFYRTRDCVLIPFFSDEESGFKLMYVQMRFLDDDPQSRYLTLEVDGGTKVWGSERVNYEEDIYIFEGAFDAMFVDNAVATAGADIFQLHEEMAQKAKKKIHLVWDSDYTKNKEVRDKIDAAVKAGLSVVLTTAQGLQGKDVNDAIKAGKSEKFVMEYLKQSTFEGLLAQLELSKHRKPTHKPKGSNGNQYPKKRKVFPKM